MIDTDYCLACAYKEDLLSTYSFYTNTPISKDFLSYLCHKYPFVRLYEKGTKVFDKSFTIQLDDYLKR